MLLILILPVVLIASCTNDIASENELTDANSAVLTILTRTGNNDDPGLESERIVKKLRMIVFNSSGNQVGTFYYSGTELENALKTNGGTYSITERFPKNLGQMRVCLIANEPASWNLGRPGGITYGLLENKMISYTDDYDFINNNNNSDDLNLYISANDYFLMNAEKTVNFGSGNITLGYELPLERTVAKVTVAFSYDQIVGVNFDNGDSFLLKNVSIQNQPIYSHLYNKEYSSDTYFPTSYKNIVSNNGTGTKITTDSIVFYIPEHYLSDDAFNADLYTYIEVLAEHVSGGVAMPVTYRIPLGEGVQNIFDDAAYSPQKADYSIVRNHHYIVNGTITKLGEKDGVQANVQIQSWKTGDNIVINKPTPYLNVSDINLQREVSVLQPAVKDQIYFWSNQPQDSITVENITAKCYNANGDQIGDLAYFLGLSPNNSLNIQKISYLPTTNAKVFFENNGYVDVDLNSQHMPSGRLEVTFYLRAGNLKRKINITYKTISVSP